MGTASKQVIYESAQTVLVLPPEHVEVIDGSSVQSWHWVFINSWALALRLVWCLLHASVR